MACEEVREKALISDTSREDLIRAYEMQAAWVEPPGVGEAQQGLTPLGGLACALIALMPGAIFSWPGRSCERATTPEGRRACESATGGFSAGAGIFCAIAAFF